MAFTTYVDLKTAVSRWVGGGDDATVTGLGISSTIDDLITVAENRIFRETRTKDTEAAFSTAIASGVISVPSDYIATKFFYVDSSPTKVLEPKPVEWIYTNYPSRSSEGEPLYFAREGANFIFGPYPDSTYTIKGIYWKRLGAVSSSAHNLYTNNPDLYLFACLAEAEILIGKDSRIPLWEAKYKKILSDVNGMSQVAEYSGASLRMRLA